VNLTGFANTQRHRRAAFNIDPIRKAATTTGYPRHPLLLGESPEPRSARSRVALVRVTSPLVTVKREMRGPGTPVRSSRKRNRFRRELWPFQGADGDSAGVPQGIPHGTSRCPVGLRHGRLLQSCGCAAPGEGCDRVPVNDEQILRRPIGWWLKEADARLDAAFDSTLRTQGVDRRGWQVLATLARSSTRRVDVVAALASFDEPAVVEGVVDELRRRGWVDESHGALRLTPVGAQEQEALAPLVENVRHQVAAALPEGDYLILVRLLARLVAGLPEPSR